MTKKKRRPVHPGELLQKEFLEPLELSAYRLAQLIDVPRSRISDIINKKRDITADTALRIARLFDMSPEFWMNAQSHYALECARDEKEADIIKTIKVLETA